MNQHNRKSIHLEEYDYSQPGGYFVTLVAQGRACLFGDVVDGEIMLNDAGRMLEKWWHKLPEKFPSILLGAFVIMPNHFHGIIIIVGADSHVRPYSMDCDRMRLYLK